MTDNSGYYDGIEVTLSDGKQSVSKRLYAEGDNSLSLQGVTASISKDAFAVDMRCGGGAGGGPGTGRPTVTIGGVKYHAHLDSDGKMEALTVAPKVDF